MKPDRLLRFGRDRVEVRVTALRFAFATVFPSAAGVDIAAALRRWA
jgi:hypothetical protein